ncbi:MAG TPA: DnaB-like helicase N-terminal domain-containing protein [Aliidongia sp.]|uniref:DnaB-like helicase N-terminal domain-containing protein n=1 Tax=Aliidongia sp. TaxID=1914230 RepID=UPI002DDC93A4|nr:DnaB-like helicase N-terminal domain-containing protein [Aliidongia sp.]HEV2676304.1 DnaB-like helicase N-terminal domain-containing protein [Aliidongia sp.]
MAGLDCERNYGILDAERELIAAILTDNRIYRAVCHLLLPAYFLSPAHQRQFAAIATAIERGRPVDLRMLETGGRPLTGMPAIDPLDHALMIYGSFLGREAIGVPLEAEASARAAS